MAGSEHPPTAGWRSNWRPFWMHQAAEYVIGLGLIAAGLQSPEPLWPTLVGGVIVLSSALVDGPLGAWRVFSRAQHRRLDLILIGVIVLAALLPFLTIDNVTRMLMVMAALVWFVVWRGSNFATMKDNRARRSQRRVERAGDRSDDLGRKAGRLVNQGRALWQQRQQRDDG